MAVLPFDSGRLNGAAQRTRSFVAGFTPGQKTVTVLAAIGIVAGSIFFFTHSSSPSYAVLFSNLQEQQAGQVTTALTNNHIPYELADGGTTVLVPQQDVNQERISLAESGLPSGGTITFQNLTSTGITSSQFVQNVEYQQALSAQLAQAIETLQGVQSAQVQLVVPQQQTFAIGNSTTPSASVLVVLQPGVTLTSTQVQAIVHLTASAVPNLSPSNVTVADNLGDVLAAPGVNISASQNAQQTAAYDQQLETSIGAELDRVLGIGNAAVQVHAVLDFNQQSTTSNSFVLGKNGAPLTAPTSKTTSSQTYSGNGGSAAAASGALGNAGSTTTPAQSGSYVNNQTSVTNAVGSVTSTIQKALGQPIATSVAVIVNANVKGATAPKFLANIRSLVTAAAGLSLAGKNSLVVTALPFAPTPALPSTTTKASIITKLKGVAPAAALVLLVLGLFIFALVSAKRRSPKFEEIPLSQLGPGDRPGGATLASLAELDTGEVPAITGQVTASLLPAIHPVPPDVDGYIKDNPAEVAQLMRHWSHERSARAGGATS